MDGYAGNKGKTLMQPLDQGEKHCKEQTDKGRWCSSWKQTNKQIKLEKDENFCFEDVVAEHLRTEPGQHWDVIKYKVI